MGWVSGEGTIYVRDEETGDEHAKYRGKILVDAGFATINDCEFRAIGPHWGWKAEWEPYGDGSQPEIKAVSVPVSEIAVIEWTA